MNADLGGGCKGITLNMIDGKDVARELVGSSGVLVCRVAPVVDTL